MVTFPNSINNPDSDFPSGYPQSQDISYIYIYIYITFTLTLRFRMFRSKIRIRIINRIWK